MQKKHKILALDAFGTICFIGEPRRAYRLFIKASDFKLPFTKSDIMRINQTPHELAKHYDFLNSDNMVAFRQELETEVCSIQLYPETIPFLEDLRDKNFRVGIISNLAQPYGKKLKSLLEPAGLIEHFVFSYEVGAIKPEAKIYHQFCTLMNAKPSHCLMIGDSYKNDFEGARAFGFDALHLSRCGLLHLNTHCTISTLKEALLLL